MKCPRCQFENMPGQTACFRCGSVLDGATVAVDVHPPRAPGWKKPIRPVKRWVRRRWAARKAVAAARRAEKAAAGAGAAGMDAFSRIRQALPPWIEFRRAVWQAIVALALSIIVPGVAHLVRRRFRTIYLYVIAWFISLALAIVLFGLRLGNEALSVAVVLHAWIAMDAVMLSEKLKEYLSVTTRIAARLAGVALLAFFIYALYGGIREVAMPGIIVAQSGIAVPAQDVELRDSILCRALTTEPPEVKRGDLVLVTVFGPGGSGLTVGQLIGLPGDKVRVTKDAAFIVNDRLLDREEFPVPQWLRAFELTATLGKETYFVTMEYGITAHGHVAVLLPDAVAHACEFTRNRILARGEMRWFPFRKRGFLKELE